MKAAFQGFVVLALASSAAAAPADFDGDGRTDFTIVRVGEEHECLEGPVSPPCPAFYGTIEYTWYTKLSSRSETVVTKSLSTSKVNTNLLDAYNAADLDNDGRADRMLLYRPLFVQDSELLVLPSRFGFRPTQLPVPSFGQEGQVVFADFHGDGSAEPASFVEEDSQMRWLIDLPDVDSLHTLWGLPGDLPVPADYTGDRRSEIAVWRPADGYWWIRDLINNQDRGIQWGLTGDYPLPGDYDGDKIADLAVWRPSDGVWYILTSSSAYDRERALVIQFGLPHDEHGYHDIPLQGDWDGDGRLDLAVYRPEFGLWLYRRSSDQQIVSVQWGLATDLPLGLGISDRIKYLY